MSFDIQIGLMVVAIVAAIIRMRVNILIVAANHFILLRAFQNLERYGQPPAYYYLPPSLFAPSALENAAVVTGVAAVMLVAAAVVPWRAPPRTEPLTPLPTFVLAIIGAYFVFLFFSTRTVLETTYASSTQVVYGASAGGGIYVLSWALAIYELRRRVDLGQLTAQRAMAVVIGLIFVLDFLKGSTGLASGILLTAGFLVFLPGLLREGAAAGVQKPTFREQARAVGLALALLAAVGATVAFIRVARSSIAVVGIASAAADAVEQIISMESDEGGEGLEASGNGTQGAAHVLMCTFLYDAGYSREWRSVWGPIEYTFKPSVLVEPLGLVRSREAAWELGDYFIHGGGINVFGELYWNGGLFCLFVVGGGLIFFLLMVDVRARSHWVWFALACAIAPGLLQGSGYGFAQIFRGIANGLIFVVPLIAYLRHVEWQRRRSGGQAPATSSLRGPAGVGARGPRAIVPRDA